MKSTGRVWRIIGWLLAIGWVPVAAEMSLNFLFRIEQRSQYTILIIPYIEFITLPLTFLAVLTALYKAAKATITFMKHDKKLD
jgi:hypothetical protein